MIKINIFTLLKNDPVMAQNKFRQIFFSWEALPIWLALATFGLTELFARHPQITEAFYSQTLYPAVAFLLSFVSQWVSFSLDDLFYALLALFLMTVFLMTIFRKIKFGRFLLLLLQTLSVCYVLFYWFWGFNYYRSGVNERLQITKSKPDTVKFVSVLENLIAQTNESYCSFDSITKNEISALIETSYKKHASFLKLNYPQGTRIPKPITLSNFFA